MIRHLFKHELLQLLRESWLLALLIILSVALAYAVFNGRQKVDERTASIAKAKADMAALDKKNAVLIDSISAGLKKDMEPWLNPVLLSVYGQRAPRVASMDAQPLAFISVGQSDLYAHYVKPKLYGEAKALGFSELTNPVQLLFGSFDVSFVCIYLLPLLIIAFSYNLLSQEKEDGSLRLTLSQPVSLYSWLLTRTALRFLIIAFVLLVSLATAFLVNGVSLSGAWSGLVKVCLSVLAYSFFWFMVSLLVNSLGKSSGQNAVALVSIWAVIVLLLPSIINQTANSLYPVPSRINMIHEYRVAEANAKKEGDKMLKTFYQDHPELAPTDTTQENKYSFWLTYFATANIVEEAVTPLLEAYDNAIENQQAWVNNLRVFSPAILLQDALNDQAGTAPAHYASFREQVVEFANEWRAYFLPRMFRNEDMKATDIGSLPEFKYENGRVASTWLADFAVTVLFTVALVGLSAWTYRTKGIEGILA